MKIVIIGGVAGGASAAARLRRLDEQAEIVVFERTGYMSYANCGLPYYIGGVIRDEADLTLQTPESFYARFRINVRVRQEVTSIDRAAKTVSVRPLDGGSPYTEHYDKLILSPGARPVKPPLPGVDSARVFTLRTVEDTLRLRAQAMSAGSGSAVIVGGGFIGVELAENFRELGLRVTIVEKQPQLLGQFDADMVSFLHAHLREKGVGLLLGRSVERFAETADGIIVHTDGGALPQADMAVLAIGVTPENTLSEAAGLELGARGAIAVDAHMRTSDPDIYAVGDAVEVIDRTTGRRTTVALAGPANRQGRVAADNICSLPSVYRGAAGSSVLKVFDRTAASTGISERTARGLGIDCAAVILSPLSHASYYPGAQVYMLEYGPEWCRVFLCAEGYMKTSQLKRTGAAKIEPIGFAFASFELGEPFVDPNGFIESLGDCDLSKHGDIVENGGALKLIGYAGEFLQIQYGNYDGFILSRYASTMPFDSILLPDEAQ